MKAISLWQPWASAIALGLKKYETRSWSTKYRGELIICSAKKKSKNLAANYKDLWQATFEMRSKFPENKNLGKVFCYDDLGFGVTIAKVNLVDCLPTHEIKPSVSELEIIWGDWQHGRYAWKFEDIEPLNPTPIKGKQGFFEVELC